MEETMERERDTERAREIEKEERERGRNCFPWKQASRPFNNLRAF